MLKRRFNRIVNPKKIRTVDFDGSLFKPLEPSSIEITKVDLGRPFDNRSETDEKA